MMVSTDHSKKGRYNLRLVKDDSQAVKSIRLPGRYEDSAHMDELHQRIYELDQKVHALQRQLEVERKQAQIDPLTGIANRRALAARLKSEIGRSKRNGTPLSLVVWDIDHFKTINDKYGHTFGDDMIRCVAQVIDSHLRDSDFTARYGGEEFVSLLPDCDTDGARSLAEKISRAIQLSGCRFNDLSLKLSVSCGIASLQGQETAETLFRRADDALYRAKVTGRNRIVVDGD